MPSNEKIKKIFIEQVINLFEIGVYVFAFFIIAIVSLPMLRQAISTEEITFYIGIIITYLIASFLFGIRKKELFKFDIIITIPVAWLLYSIIEYIKYIEHYGSFINTLEQNLPITDLILIIVVVSIGRSLSYLLGRRQKGRNT